MTRSIPRTRFVLPFVCGLAVVAALTVSPIPAAGESPPPPAPVELATDADPQEAAGLCAVEAAIPALPVAEAGALGGPGEIPDYCTECRPCTRQIDCGWDNGYLGVCVSNPSHCNTGGRSACICY